MLVVLGSRELSEKGGTLLISRNGSSARPRILPYSLIYACILSTK
jgi:hypothetical protein